MGTYLLITIGAVTGLTNGAAACPTWPACHGRWLVPLSDLSLVIVWSHRVITLIVGLLLAGATVVAWRGTVTRRVKASLAIALILYPVQIEIGAITAVTGGSRLVSALHLGLGMGIFSAILVALTWTLKPRTPSMSTSTGEMSGTTVHSDTTESATSSDPRVDSQDGADSTVARSPRLHWITETLQAYLSLTKPALMWLLCLVAVAAMAVAGGPTLTLGTVAATLLGGCLATGASGTFNNVIERDRDEKMARTADRPIPQNRIPVRHAVVFGLTLAGLSVTVFITFVNLLTAVLGLLAILFYSVVYTVVLKPHTTQNIVLGGAVGAFPALIGWAAVTDTLGLPAFVLGGIIFLWTPAHFYNLALAYQDDYERGGFPMLSVVRGEAVTRAHILLYLGATLLAASVFGVLAPVGWLYAGTTIAVGAVFLWTVLRLHYEQTDTAALRTFHASNAYLGSLLVAIVVDTVML